MVWVLESYGELQTLPLPIQVITAQDMVEHLYMEISRWPNSSQARKISLLINNLLKNLKFLDNCFKFFIS